MSSLSPNMLVLTILFNVVNLFKMFLKGLCWVLSYYYEGVHTGRWCAFNWAFPFHYAPFAADLANYCDAPAFQPPKEYEPAEAVLAGE